MMADDERVIPFGVPRNGKRPAQDENALQSIDVCDLLVLALPAPEFVVQYLFPRKALVLFSGDSGAAKTAFLTHAAMAMQFEMPIGGRLPSAPGAKVLYVNGEISEEILQQNLRQSLAGLGVSLHDLPRGRFRYEGATGFSECYFRFDPFGKGNGQEDQARFELLLDEFGPDLVVFDTQRALFNVDDRDTPQVMQQLRWLKRLAIKYNAAVVLLQHLRKLGAGNNSVRERSGGVKTFIDQCDVHLEAISKDGLPMTAIKFGKTRTPKDDVRTGIEFPVEAVFVPATDGDAGRSAFYLKPPIAAIANVQAATTSKRNAQIGGVKAHILLWAEKQPSVKPFTLAQLKKTPEAGGIGGNSADIAAAFKSLVDDKQLGLVYERSSRHGGDLYHLARFAPAFHPDDEPAEEFPCPFS